MDKKYIINNHIVKHLFNEYHGSEKKWTVLLDDGYKYMLKFPDPVREINREVSYINNAFSEYIGCKIYESLDIPVQKTKLGYFITDDGKEKVACLCQDFRKEGEQLFEIDKLELEQFDEIQPLSFQSVERTISKIDGLNTKQTMDFYYDMFVIDSFIGNTDRHNGNWGLLVSNDTIKLAPVYDCGSSLSPLLSENELTEARTQNDAINIKSSISVDGQRIHYRDYIASHNPEVDDALKRIVPKIDLYKINKIIEDIPYISEKRKNFYKSLLSKRYDQILMPALKESLHQNEQIRVDKAWSSKIIEEIWDKEMFSFAALANGSTQILRFHENDLIIRKNSDNIFCYKNDELLCTFNCKKSNKNISDFVQTMQKINIDIISLYNYPSIGQANIDFE